MLNKWLCHYMVEILSCLKWLAKNIKIISLYNGCLSAWSNILTIECNSFSTKTISVKENKFLKCIAHNNHTLTTHYCLNFPNDLPISMSQVSKIVFASLFHIQYVQQHSSSNYTLSSAKACYYLSFLTLILNYWLTWQDKSTEHYVSFYVLF